MEGKSPKKIGKNTLEEVPLSEYIPSPRKPEISEYQVFKNIAKISKGKTGMDIKGIQNVTFSVAGKLADFQVRSLKMETS